MEYTRLGNTGTEVSRICLGCMSFGDSSVGLTGKGWAVDEEPAREIIKKALDLEIIDRVALLAERRGVPMIQISLAWLLSKPAVTAPILGATKLNHFEDAIVGLDTVKLTGDEIKYLEEPYTAHNVIGFD